ncbi:MAG TPA: hypothetical protein VF600_08740 [Abditibacteriaceae bacterium]|jgi:hypothetical protein
MVSPESWSLSKRYLNLNKHKLAHHVRYFARTVGDKVTAEVIQKYIQHHRDDKSNPQIDLFSSPLPLKPHPLAVGFFTQIVMNSHVMVP